MHIGFASQNPSSHYWLIVNRGAQERATELGIDITIVPAYTVEQQIAAINTFISQRVDVLMLGPASATGLAGAVERARSAGIPVVVVAAQLSDCEVACTVRSDHMKGAELAATYVVEQLGGVGEVAHLVGPSILLDNIDRAIGVRKVFDQHPGIKVVFEQEAPDWRHATAAGMMREALDQHPNLRGVCVANDTLALGAAEAITAAGRTGQVLVTGFDATPEALTAINEGRIAATVRQSVRGIGCTGVELAQRLARRADVPPLVFTEISLVTRDNLLDAALESVYLLPGVLRDAVERAEALAKARDEVIQVQKLALRELSTPLIPISDTVMVMPLIGAIDSQRGQQVIETLLEGVSAHRTTTVILDITGVLIVDTQVANALIQAAQAVRLLGAQVVLTGVRPEVAQTLVGLGVDLRAIVTHSTLQSGIAYALRER